MESQGIESLIELINRIKVTDDNEADVDLMKELIDEKRYTEVITILNKLKNEKRIILRNSATIEETKKEVRKNIVKRDRLQKLAGFYKIYPNTITVDVTNCNSVEESTEKVYNLICKEGIKNNGIC